MGRRVASAGFPKWETLEHMPRCFCKCAQAIENTVVAGDFRSLLCVKSAQVNENKGDIRQLGNKNRDRDRVQFGSRGDTPLVFAKECGNPRKKGSWAKNRVFGSAQGTEAKGFGFALEYAPKGELEDKACPGGLEGGKRRGMAGQIRRQARVRKKSVTPDA
jgi:hypothetical protein